MKEQNRVALLAWTLLLFLGAPGLAQQRQFLDRYCMNCHSNTAKMGSLSLDTASLPVPAADPALWEKIVRKVRTGVMPPPNAPQPPTAERRAVLTALESSLDAVPINPGRTESLRRLNRTEYQNAIRDLLAVDIDATALLPADESGHGFDNVNVGDLSPALLNRYITAAQKISRLAVGSSQSGLQSETIGLRADLTQEDHLAGMPIGTRGGMSVPYTFVQDGEYEIQVLLARDLTGTISGLRDTREHQLLLLIDRQPVHTFTVSRAAIGDQILNEKELKTRVPVKAGPRNIAVTFVKEGSSLADARPPAARVPLQRPPLPPHRPRRRPDSQSPARFLRRAPATLPAAAVCSSAAREPGGRRPLRGDHSLHPDAPRLPASGGRCRSKGADGVLSQGPREGRFRRRHHHGRRRRAHQPQVPLPRGNRSAEGAASTGSAISNSPRDSPSSFGAASRTTNCSTRP
jgi:hypothetical protein